MTKNKLNLWEVICIIKFTSKRPMEDVYTDIRAIKGVTIVNSLSQTKKKDDNTQQSIKIAKLHIKFTPGELPIQKYILWLRNEINNVFCVLGSVFLVKTIKYIGKGD